MTQRRPPRRGQGGSGDTPQPRQASGTAVALADVIRLPLVSRYQDGKTTDALDDVQQAALQLLLSGECEDYEEVAEALGIPAAYVHGWMSFDPNFIAALNAAQGRRRKLVQLEIERGGLVATRALIDIVEKKGDATITPRDRINAANALLSRLGDVTSEVPSKAAGRESDVSRVLAGMTIPSSPQVIDVEAEPDDGEEATPE